MKGGGRHIRKRGGDGRGDILGGGQEGREREREGGTGVRRRGGEHTQRNRGRLDERHKPERKQGVDVHRWRKQEEQV